MFICVNVVPYHDRTLSRVCVSSQEKTARKPLTGSVRSDAFGYNGSFSRLRNGIASERLTLRTSTFDAWFLIPMFISIMRFSIS